MRSKRTSEASRTTLIFIVCTASFFSQYKYREDKSVVTLNTFLLEICEDEIKRSINNAWYILHYIKTFLFLWSCNTSVCYQMKAWNRRIEKKILFYICKWSISDAAKLMLHDWKTLYEKYIQIYHHFVCNLRRKLYIDEILNIWSNSLY